ncbi:hypothetical protein DICVIV_04098 [Dictyocaulus viviparus]|uniref:Uncharacterized protein n=1 Tax=Dictyocaulus viviparus TaxID=29172 RepID=A0A0D8XYQ1_DICVI|nr:hypothetical protein DICVIV_04098 [Dictyocaulus viviparus]
MESSHQPNEVVNADSVAMDVKPVVAAPILSEKSAASSDASDSGSGNADVLNTQQIAHKGFLSDLSRSNTESSSDVQSLLSEVVALRHAKCVIEEELLDVKGKYRELCSRNNELQSQMASSIDDMNERSQMYRQLESSRNELAVKKMALDAELERLKHEKEERDNAIRNLTREKHLVNNAIFYSFLSQSSKLLSWQREKIMLKDEIARLQLAAEEHEGQLQLRKKQVDDTLAKITEVCCVYFTFCLYLYGTFILQLSNEHSAEIADLEAELRKERELSNVYKESMEKAEKVAAEISEQWKARENLFEETKQVLAEVQEEIEEEKRMKSVELAMKDEQISELKDELLKANELLKSKHAVNLNVSEEELSILSPAAVETARLLRGGQSLTSIVREHARLSGELAESRERNKQLEISLREMVEEIEGVLLNYLVCIFWLGCKRAPQLFHQKELLDKTFDHNIRLQEQLKEADEARCRLESVRDATIRELAFTRAELEKFQRDYASASKQVRRLFVLIIQFLRIASVLLKVQHLLFVLERERQGGENDVDNNDEENARLFSSIAQLQNLNLFEQRRRICRIDCLKRELESSHKTETSLKGELEQMRTTFELLQSQADQLKKLADDNVSVVEARAAKIKAEEAVAKELESSRKEQDQIRDENDRLRTSEAQMAGKMEQLQNELIELQRKTSSYKIENRSLKEELEHARLTINRLESEVDSFRRTSFGEQQVSRYEQEISLVRQQLGEKEKELMLCERQLVDLRTRLSSMQAQYTAHESTIGMTPERLQKECQQLKNRSQYLECQLDEMKSKLAEAESVAVKKSDENDRMESHSKLLESNIKQMAELGSMERERLEARATSAEVRAEELSSRVASLSTTINQLELEISDSKMEHVKKSSEMQLKVDILEAQIKDADSSIANLNELLNTTRSDLERNLAEKDELTSQLDELKSLTAAKDEEIILKNTKLDSKEKELLNARENLRLVEENLQATEKRLASRAEEIAAYEAKYSESIKNYEDKLDQIMEKYENVASQICERGYTTADSKEDNLSATPTSSLAVVESLQSVVKFLREEKQMAVSRSMTAEVEVKRMRAEVAEIRAGRDELAATVRRLQSEVVASADALAERTQLLERLEAMASVQRQNTMYRCENEKLHKVSSELAKQKREVEAKISEMTASANDALTKVSLLSSELAAKKKENDLLRQRVAEATLKGDQEIRAELDQCRSKLSRVEAELTKANLQAVEAEKQKLVSEARVKELVAKHNDTCTKFEATRKLARRYRDEVRRFSILIPTNPSMSDLSILFNTIEFFGAKVVKCCWLTLSMKLFFRSRIYPCL